MTCFISSKEIRLDINNYISTLKSLDNSYYIFGAGRIANVVYGLLKDNNIAVDAFVVSNSTQNKKELHDISVLQADSYEVDKTKAVLIAVIEHGDKKIHSYLESLGFTKIIDTPEGIFDYDPWEHKRFRSPIIEVTSKIGCAVNCKYCPQKLLIERYYTDNKNRKNIMTFVDYKRFLDKCPAETIVDFSGFVEPFLNDDSIAMMEYTYQTGHEMTLFTTLRGLTFERAEKVVKMPFRYVCLHTPDKDGFANIPMTDEYFKILDLFLDAKKKNGEPFIDVANCQSEAHPDVIKHSQGKLKIYCEMSDRAGNLDKNDPTLTHARKEGAIYCSRAAAMNHFVLLPDGSLALCCNDFGLKHIVGNLNDSSYQEIVQGDVMKNLFMQMKESGTEDIICRQCMFAEVVKRVD